MGRIKHVGGLHTEDKTIFDTWISKWKELTDAINRQQKQQRFDNKIKKKQLVLQERQNPSELRKQMSHMIKELVSNGMPYFVLCLALYVIFMLLTGGFNSRRSENSTVKQLKNTEEMIKSRFNGFIGSIYLFLYNIWDSIRMPPQLKRLLNMFSSYEHGGPTVPRTLIDSGRCDNIKWIETSDDGEFGTCTSAIRPQDLTWKLNPTLNSEFKQDSEFMSHASEINDYDPKKTAKWLGQWTNNTEIIIPWDRSPETSFFVPQCEQSYFANQCRKELNSERCVENEHWTASGFCCAKTNLLVEQGLTCGLASFDKGDYILNQNNKNQKATSPSYANITKTNLAGSQKKIKLDTKTVNDKPSSKISAFIG